MKLLGLAVVRTGSDLNEPIPLHVTNDLSSFGFFQRQVRLQQNTIITTFLSVSFFRFLHHYILLTLRVYSR